jgi:hypothetical protein
VRRVNWTIVAISAGITLGASVAVLSTENSVPETSGLVVPRWTPIDDETPAPPPAAQMVDVVTVSAAGYTQSLTPPPPPPPPRPAPVKKARAPKTILSVPKQVVSTTTNTVSTIANQALSPWSGWFVDSGSFNYFGDNSVGYYDAGRHWSDSRGGDGGGRHRACDYGW